MKLNDAIWGALLLLLSALIFFTIRTFPTIPGQQVGPALFPGVIASALAACGLLLIAKGLLARRTGGVGSPWIAFSAWLSSPAKILAFALVIAVNVFYIFAVDTLGFIVTAVIYLSLLFWVFGVRARWNLPLAIVVTLVIHSAFYKLLKVPLPWGLLQRFAW
jgi:putative tricarboxylic transport membrane protein